MMKGIQTLTCLSLVLLFAGVSFGQIVMDGDSTDWADEPVLVEWFNNEEGVYPDEVGALVDDRVDVKHLRAKVVGNNIYFFIRFWNDPAVSGVATWPNEADQFEYEGTPLTRSRGYYHVMVDLDNDATTGWNSAQYEAHFTPVGYLESQGVEGAVPIGGEAYFQNGYSYYKPSPHPDSAGIKNTGVADLNYESYDVSEYDGATDSGVDYLVSGHAPADPDSADGFGWQGALPVDDSDNEALATTDRYFWSGHGWGPDFLEFGMELTPQIEYWQDKGQDYYKPGDTIGLCAFIETPADDWGVDMSTRGEYTLPMDMTMRPSSIAFDGDDSDWEDRPLLVDWFDNQEGVFPDEVGAAIDDRVDIKEIKAFVNNEENAIYYLFRFWNDPAVSGVPTWPNEAKQSEYEGTPITRSRGYYHILLDMDNDITTGWNTSQYEAHYTPVGYIESQGIEGADPMGADGLFYWGCRYRYPPPHPDSGGVKDSGVQDIDYEASDVEEYDGATDSGTDYWIFGYSVNDPDSSRGMMFDGQLVGGSDDELLDGTGPADWNAHAWGSDFIEVGHSTRMFKEYWMNKKGWAVLQDGDEVGVCAMIETPADDWGVDMSTRGVMTVGMATGVADNRAGLVDGFALGNNYPNPFNPETVISYSVPNAAEVSLSIYNTLGQKVRSLVDGATAAGNYKATWDGRNDYGQLLSSGIYYYTLKSDKTAITKRMVFLK